MNKPRQSRFRWTKPTSFVHNVLRRAPGSQLRLRSTGLATAASLGRRRSARSRSSERTPGWQETQAVTLRSRCLPFRSSSLAPRLRLSPRVCRCSLHSFGASCGGTSSGSVQSKIPRSSGLIVSRMHCGNLYAGDTAVRPFRPARVVPMAAGWNIAVNSAYLRKQQLTARQCQTMRASVLSVLSRCARAKRRTLRGACVLHCASGQRVAIL